MKSHTEYLVMNVPGKMAFVNITGKVQAAITNIQHGETILVSPTHPSSPEDTCTNTNVTWFISCYDN